MGTMGYVWIREVAPGMWWRRRWQTCLALCLAPVSPCLALSRFVSRPVSPCLALSRFVFRTCLALSRPASPSPAGMWVQCGQEPRRTNAENQQIRSQSEHSGAKIRKTVKQSHEVWCDPRTVHKRNKNGRIYESRSKFRVKLPENHNQYHITDKIAINAGARLEFGDCLCPCAFFGAHGVVC